MRCFTQRIEKFNCVLFCQIAIFIILFSLLFSTAKVTQKSCDDRNVPNTAGVCAFTIAELLIIIGLIGTVATLLLPNLINGYQTMITMSSLQNAYAISSNAFELAVAEKGTPDTWGLGSSGDQAALENLNNIMSEHLNTIKNCGTGSGCFPDTQYRDIRGLQNPVVLDQNTNYTKMILNNGLLISFTTWDGDCKLSWGNTQALNNICGMAGVDINGFRGPNQYGVDYFGFVITKYGILPMGSDPQTSYTYNDYCNKETTADTGYEDGLSCSAEIISKSKGNCGNGIGKGGAAGSGLGNGIGNTCSPNS